MTSTAHVRPATEAVAEDLDVVIARLRAAFATGQTRTLEWRTEQLRGLRRFLAENEGAIADALHQDLRRDAFNAWFGDIAPVVNEIEHSLKHLKSWMRPRSYGAPMSLQPASARVQYEPLGVVLVIGAWNYPINLSLGPVVAALSAGNCVVLKPSEIAPATSRLMADLLPTYLSSDALAVVEGDGATTQALLAQGLDLAFFTGGTQIGKLVMESAARTLTPVILELGGKSPVIVTPDANLEVAARRIAWIKLLNSGQTCIAPDYVLAHDSIKDELVEKLSACLAEFRGNDAEGQPMVNERQYCRVKGYLAATEGVIATGGETDDESLTILPTILVDPSPSEPAMTEEIFGPVLPVSGYSDLDEVVRFVNGREKPLGLYVFSDNKKVADDLIARIPAGGAVVNHCALHFLAPNLPFGGVGASGMGSYHGEWGFQNLSHRKAVLSKPSWMDLKFAYPPYGPKVEALLRRLF